MWSLCGAYVEPIVPWWALALLGALFSLALGPPGAFLSIAAPGPGGLGQPFVTLRAGPGPGPEKLTFTVDGI